MSVCTNPLKDSEVQKTELQWEINLVLTLLSRRNKRHALFIRVWRAQVEFKSEIIGRGGVGAGDIEFPGTGRESAKKKKRIFEPH